eukprot:615996-Amphidinium_carterae.1
MRGDETLGSVASMQGAGRNAARHRNVSGALWQVARQGCKSKGGLGAAGEGDSVGSMPWRAKMESANMVAKL